MPINLLDSLSYDEFKILSDKTRELKKCLIEYRRNKNERSKTQNH